MADLHGYSCFQGVDVSDFVGIIVANIHYYTIKKIYDPKRDSQYENGVLLAHHGTSSTAAAPKAGMDGTATGKISY
jgi:hypothetical protein